MNIALLYYDGFSEFEIAIMALLFKRHNLIAVALENREYRSEENQRFCFDQLVRDVDVGLRIFAKLLGVEKSSTWRKSDPDCMAGVTGCFSAYHNVVRSIANNRKTRFRIEMEERYANRSV